MFCSLSVARSRGSMYAGEESGKSCCGVVVTQTVSIRWFIVMIAFVGICCAVVGTVLGAMRTSGREHLTVSLLMNGTLIISLDRPHSLFPLVNDRIETIDKHKKSLKGASSIWPGNEFRSVAFGSIRRERFPWPHALISRSIFSPFRPHGDTHFRFALLFRSGSKSGDVSTFCRR